MEKQGPSSCSSSKRFRQTNYSMEEKNYLLQLVDNYKHILENKKTDAVNNFSKEKAWQKLACEFNAVAPNNTQRDAASLKKAYLNIKKTVRKEVAEEKIEMIKTGSGTPINKKRDPLQQMALQAMNTKTVFGFQHPFDSDTISCNNGDTFDKEVHENQSSSNEDVEFIYIQNDDETENNWRKWKPQDLKGPLNEDLANKIHMVHGDSDKTLIDAGNNKSGKENVKNRRRPAAIAMHSSEMGKLYTKLCEERLEIAQIEKTILQNKKDSQKTKDDLQIEILRTELQIKNQELNKLTRF